MNSPNQLSFLPEDYLERKAQQRTNVIFALLFLIVGVAIVTTFTIDERRTREELALELAVEQEYEEAAKRIEQFHELQAKQRTVAQQAELTASLLEKAPRSNLLAAITNATPAGVSLLEFSLDSRRTSTAPPPQRSALDQRRAAVQAARTPSSPAPAPNTPPAPAPIHYDVSMKMTGIARTDVQVAQFMQALTRNELLQEVNLLYTDQFELQGDRLRRFQIEMTLNPAASVQPPAHPGRSTVSLPLD
jgi:Tfp pilus assembly protein PilN